MGFWKSLGLFSAVAAATSLTRSEQSYPDYDALAGCPGYEVSHIREDHSGISAHLTLAGKACNVYGDDLKDLKLEVTYENGMYMCKLHPAGILAPACKKQGPF